MSSLALSVPFCHEWARAYVPNRDKQAQLTSREPPAAPPAQSAARARRYGAGAGDGDGDSVDF